MIRITLWYFLALLITFSCEGQSNIISVNSNYILGTAKIKSSWNVLGEKKAYNTQNGYSFGFDWKNAKNLTDRYNYSISSNYNNFRIERSPKNSPSRDFEKFSYVNLRFNNFLRLTKRIDASFSPSVNYLISLNSYTESSIGKFKTNNYFGQGFNNEKIGLNKFTAAFSTGLRFRTKFGNVRLQYNSAIQPIAYIKDFAPFKLFLSSFEVGIVNPVLRF
jgi:hypothetical protein